MKSFFLKLTILTLLFSSSYAQASPSRGPSEVYKNFKTLFSDVSLLTNKDNGTENFAIDKNGIIKKRSGLFRGLKGGSTLEVNFQNGKPDGPFKLYNTKGELVVESAYKMGIFTGKFKHYNFEKNIFTEYNLTPDWDKMTVRVFHLNGKLKEEGSLINKKIEGPYYQYDDDGNLILEVNYIDNKREGLLKMYFPGTKKIQAELPYKNGMLDGIVRIYTIEGKLTAESNYVKNIQGQTISYADDGKIDGVVKDGNLIRGRYKYMKHTGFYKDTAISIDEDTDKKEESNLESTDKYESLLNISSHDVFSNR